MIISQRHAKILNLIKDKGVVTVTELCDLVGSSEATIRRDLTILHNERKLNKVFGGATMIDESTIIMRESNIDEKKNQNIEEKTKIAKYAVSLIKDYDCVYIDAGSSTSLIANFAETTKALFVTNGIEIARTLTAKNLKTILLGGNIKINTDSVVGQECVLNLQKFNFIKGFFGTNGITKKQGFTTHDINEANVKTVAMSHCKESFMLADSTKFDKIYSVKFADIDDATIITTKANYKTLEEETKIIYV